MDFFFLFYKFSTLFINTVSIHLENQNIFVIDYKDLIFNHFLGNI